jgi:hypothetical protein
MLPRRNSSDTPPARRNSSEAPAREDLDVAVRRVALSRRNSVVAHAKAEALVTGAFYTELPAMLLEKHIVSCARHDELGALTAGELSMKISSAELMELAVALGVTPSAAAFWQTHKTIDDVLGLIFDKTVAAEDARRAALAEVEEASPAAARARAAAADAAAKPAPSADADSPLARARRKRCAQASHASSRARP